jgi:putative transposase
MYHVYNRGIDKRIIFIDERDYAVFLSFLKYALLSDEQVNAKNEVDQELISKAQRFNIRRLGLAGKVELVAFCLMPNHFHLLLYQEDSVAISKLMSSVGTGYSMYFNKRYKRSGRLFQGVYKAVRIKEDPYYQHISRYIHLNPVDLRVDYKSYPYSSYRMYVNEAQADWVHPELGMSDMSVSQYEKFVGDWASFRNELKQVEQKLADH